MENREKMLTVSMLFEEEDPRKKVGWGKYIAPGLIGAGVGLMGYGAYKHYQDQHRWDDMNRAIVDKAKKDLERQAQIENQHVLDDARIKQPVQNVPGPWI